MAKNLVINIIIKEEFKSNEWMVDHLLVCDGARFKYKLMGAMVYF